jgi:hypothetical protein
LQDIDITSVDEFMSCDPYEVFFRLKAISKGSLCRCALASIVGAHEGVVWHKITHETAREFDRRFPENTWKDKC